MSAIRSAQRGGRSVLLLVVSAALLCDGGATAHGDPWTIVALPDTQKYCEDAGRFSQFLDQTNWIANNLATEGIVFVSHEGDLVEHGSSATEWGRADQAMDVLDGNLVANPDGLVPYAAVIGNHDYQVTGNRGSGAMNYVANFGASRYSGRSWYGGSSADELNHYQFFDGGGYTFLHIGLEWEVPGTRFDPATSMGWAQGVMDAHPNTPTIITTHSYIWDQPGEEGRTQSAQSAGGNSGEAVFQQLVSPNPQVFMVLCGHFHKAADGQDGEYHQVSANAAGLPVYEMLADYQDYPDGGQGWLRTVGFVPGGGAQGTDRIEVRTYSPTSDQYQTDGNSQFHFDLVFDERFDVSGVPRPEQVSFQQGVGGFSGTVDTMLAEGDPDGDHGSDSTIGADLTDGSYGNKETQVVLRFDGIFGDGPGQVPLHMDIVKGTLLITVTNGGDRLELHRMLVDWTDADTWNSLVDGVQPDDSDAMAVADAITGSSVGQGTLSLDVTDSLIAWQADPDSNYGWALLPTDTDGVDFYSAEGATPPMLIVTYIPEPATLALLSAAAMALLGRKRR
jgi:hypothetical protein